MTGQMFCFSRSLSSGISFDVTKHVFSRGFPTGYQVLPKTKKLCPRKVIAMGSGSGSLILHGPGLELQGDARAS